MSLSKAKRIETLRGAVVKIVRLLSNRNIPVYQAGKQAYVQWSAETMEPEAVHLPVIPDDASDELILAVQGFLDHEVAHILYSDFLCVVEAKQLGISALHNMVEDCFIEQKMASEFSGSSMNLEYMRGVFLDKYTSASLAKITTPDAQKYWNVLGIVAMRAWSGQDIFARFMSEGDHWEKIQEVVDKLGSDIIGSFQSIKDSHAALSLAMAIKKKLYEPPEEKENEDKGDSSNDKKEKGDDEQEENTNQQSDSDSEEGEESNSNSEEEGDSEPEEEGDSEPEEEGDSEPEEEGEGEDSDSEEDEGSSTKSQDDDVTDQNAKGAMFEEDSLDDLQDYDKFMEEELAQMAQGEISNAQYTPFTRDWDIIQKVSVDHVANIQSMVDTLDANVSKMVAPLQREMERMFRANNKSRWEGGHRSGKINASALARMATNDDRIFRRREEIKTKEVAVSLLIDCSGSMEGNRIEMAISTAWALSQALDRLKITHEVIGFTTIESRTFTEGYYASHRECLKNQLGGIVPEQIQVTFDKFNGLSRSEQDAYGRCCAVYMPIFKEYHESFSNDVKKRMAAYGGNEGFMWSNADGESIMYAAQRLLKRKENGKTMLVLSDGSPAYERGYSSMTPSEHLKKTIDMLSKANFNMVGIGIDTDYVERYYPKSVVIRNLDELPVQVMRELKSVILQK